MGSNQSLTGLLGGFVGNFEIGRVLHFKSEIRKLKSDLASL
jgi:hypothetical protein